MRTGATSAVSLPMKTLLPVSYTHLDVYKRQEIFVFFVPQRMALWYGAEMNSCFEVQGGAADFATGQKVRITGRLGNREVTLTVVITAYEWERLLEWQFQDCLLYTSRCV